MYRLIALGLSALAFASTSAVRAEEPAPAAPAAEAAQVAAAPASAAAKPAQHCWKEYRVGSNMPVTHCESAEENEQLREERMRNIQNQVLRSNNGMKAPGP